MLFYPSQGAFPIHFNIPEIGIGCSINDIVSLAEFYIFFVDYKILVHLTIDSLLDSMKYSSPEKKYET